MDFLARPLRSVVCSPASFEGQSRVQYPFEGTCPLPEGFGGNEARRLLIRHVGEAARKAVRASILQYLH